MELTREEMSPLTLLTGGASSGASALAMLQARSLPAVPAAVHFMLHSHKLPCAGHCCRAGGLA